MSSQSHIATDGQSISKSWCRAPSGAHDQIFITLWQLRSCFCGTPSLTRGRVCLLYMLLALASVVFLGSESLGTRDHILLSLVNIFLQHLQIVTTSNYSDISNSNTLQLTIACTMSSQSAVSSPVVAWWRISTMYYASMLTFLPAGDYAINNSELLHNDLQNRGLLRAPYLCQGQPSATTSDGLAPQLLTTDSRLSTHSKSKSYWDRLSVSQWVLVPSPIWGSWSDIFTVWQSRFCLCGAPSLTRGRVCLLSEYSLLI
jgi:hypothetical protein